MLRIVYSAYARPYAFPLDPSAEFMPGMVAQLTVTGNQAVSTVSDGTAPIGIIDDIKTRSFRSTAWDEEIIVDVINPIPSPNGGFMTSVDIKAELANPNIISSSFVSDPVPVQLIPRNGVIIFPAGTKLNYDHFGTGTANAIKTFVRYTYQVPNILGDDSTAGSQRMTVWLHRFIGETDQYDSTAVYPVNANLFVNAAGLLTTTQPGANYPSVAIVTAPPSPMLANLQFMWL